MQTVSLSPILLESEKSKPEGEAIQPHSIFSYANGKLVVQKIDSEGVGYISLQDGILGQAKKYLGVVASQNTLAIKSEHYMIKYGKQ